ncbi:hypothetical protein [uncultured Enterobacter sp.]|uniref:hypothetical protein n=1 Tax=uncultured Enterobacter sp. TaxID=238202 RepID=UPI00262617D0|nr:hypothetical protein [uncultured Enterobacter sp.]
MKISRSVGVMLIAGAQLGMCFSVQAGLFSKPIDLSKPFVCKDISPTPMRITEKGLIIGGIVYPLYNPNAASTPTMTNSIFRSKDNLEEIDILQYASDGEISVSYMKFYSDPDQFMDEALIEKNKIFEKASFAVDNPNPYFHSKNQGCHQ